MTINIDKDYRVRTDARNFILQKYSINEETDKLQWNDIGFFNSLKHLMTRCLLLKIRYGDLDTIEEISNKIEEFQKNIEKIFANIDSKMILKTSNKVVANVV